MIKTVIFDVDDTIYSFHAANEAAAGQLALYTRDNFGWSKEEFLERQKNAMADVKRFAGTSGGYRARILRYQNMLEAAGLRIFPHARIMSSIYQNALLENMVPEPGVEDWMRYLISRHIRIGIGSDATAMQQILKLEKLGLLKYVDFMVTSEEAGVEKPDQRFFERLNEKTACLPGEVMFIGDNPKKDYAGAVNAGYNGVWYNPNKIISELPMRELHHYSEAPALLAELNLT